jgi:hypothetical protein
MNPDGAPADIIGAEGMWQRARMGRRGRKQDALGSEHTPFPVGPERIYEKSHPQEEEAEGFK